CIATMCISQLYQKLVSIASEYPDLALPRYVYFLLDEFANLPKIEKMASLITVARSRKIFFEMVIQSYSQLDSKYGEQDAKTIIGNCPIQIYIGTDDQKTKEEFSKMCGEQSLELEQTTESKSDKKDQGKSTTTSKQVVTRPLIGPYELGQLPTGTCIVKIFQNDPIKTPFTRIDKIPEFDTTVLEDEYFPSRPFDEEAIYYDVQHRNKIILKPKGGFDPFDF
ncbi:MAG: TraM recognition domain-containing protein, partial [Clostridia bacterium]|nr:TraM recognition domain-containing protein [Clostridia bacterium]